MEWSTIWDLFTWASSRRIVFLDGRRARPLMEIRLIIYGLLLIPVMIFYPPGLVDIFQRIGELIRRRRSV